MWLGTFPTAEEAAQAYDAVAWRYNRPRSELNFPHIESAEHANAVAPDFRVVSRAVENEDRKALRQIRAEQTDTAMMERYRQENPELVAAEYEFWMSRDAKKIKTEEAVASTAAGPSTSNPVINIKDSDHSFGFSSDFSSDDDSGVDWKLLRNERP